VWITREGRKASLTLTILRPKTRMSCDPVSVAATCRLVSLMLITIILPCDVLRHDARYQQSICTVISYLTVRDHEYQLRNVSYEDVRCYVATLVGLITLYVATLVGCN
jgi:hypothetical protein